MYVCLCQGVTERQIKDEITHNGACSMRDLNERLGVAQNCGMCDLHAKRILAESIQAQRSSE